MNVAKLIVIVIVPLENGKNGFICTDYHSRKRPSFSNLSRLPYRVFNLPGRFWFPYVPIVHVVDPDVFGSQTSNRPIVHCCLEAFE